MPACSLLGEHSAKVQLLFIVLNSAFRIDAAHVWVIAEQVMRRNWATNIIFVHDA